MQHKTTLIVVAAVLVGLVGGYALGQNGGYNDMGDHHYEKKNYETENFENNEGMNGTMMQQQGITERAFLEHMIPHHEEAVATANEVLARGGTLPELRSLATAIVTNQQKEVAAMKGWYETWYDTPYTPSATYQPMMQDLSSLSGAELDRVFLRDMIEHHMDALMMAQMVSKNIEHPELLELTKAIAEAQSGEIITMRMLLRRLP